MSAEHCLYRFTTWTSTQSLQSTVRGPRGRIFSTISVYNPFGLLRGEVWSAASPCGGVTGAVEASGAQGFPEARMAITVGMPGNLVR